jgi:hypothetical protein
VRKGRLRLFRFFSASLITATRSSQRAASYDNFALVFRKTAFFVCFWPEKRDLEKFLQNSCFFVCLIITGVVFYILQV